MQVADLNIVNAIISLEVQVIAQGQIIDKLMRSSSAFIPQNEIDLIVKNAQQVVKNKYPQLGIAF